MEDSDIVTGHPQVTDSDDELSDSGSGIGDMSSCSPYLSDEDDDEGNSTMLSSNTLPAVENLLLSSKPRREKIKADSSVRIALQNKKAPLLAYFKQCSPEEYQANLDRDREIMACEVESMQAKENITKQLQLLQKRERAKLRQRKHRQKKREKEVVQGLRSPHGSKRKQVLVELTDPGFSKKHRTDLAEDTRPARALQRVIKDKNRDRKGRKRKHKPRQAKYHNWFTPMCWKVIEHAAKVAGWRMSATEIVRVAKARNPEIFEGLTRETVKGWIDRSGEKPRWSDATLCRIEAGNTPGHPNGGPRGALVSISHLSSW